MKTLKTLAVVLLVAGPQAVAAQPIDCALPANAALPACTTPTPDLTGITNLNPILPLAAAFGFAIAAGAGGNPGGNSGVTPSTTRN